MRRVWLQRVLRRPQPLAAFAQGPRTFHLTGGLSQAFAPSAVHLQHAFLPLLQHIGLHAALRILRPGYVPRGGGSLVLTVEPVHGTLRPWIYSGQRLQNLARIALYTLKQ
jgi:RNA 3'-terminal phosphate cyclase